MDIRRYNKFNELYFRFWIQKDSLDIRIGTYEFTMTFGFPIALLWGNHNSDFFHGRVINIREMYISEFKAATKVT